jgi:transcription elongation factor S-II
MQVTVEALRKSHIGRSVNALRKGCCSEQVKSLAKRLIHTWKKQLEAENSHDNISKDNVVNSDTGGSDIDQTPTTTGTDPTSLRGSKLNSVKTESSSRETNRTSLPDVPDTTDDVRSKCRDMLVKALKKTHVEGIDDHHIVHLAAVIEDCISCFWIMTFHCEHNKYNVYFTKP